MDFKVGHHFLKKVLFVLKVSMQCAKVLTPGCYDNGLQLSSVLLGLVLSSHLTLDDIP